MRPGQNKRMRGRNNRKGPNPLTRSYESNGPDVKIRGTAHHVAEKYLQLARDAQSSGDPVMAESYLQHAEHYFRIIALAQAAQLQAQQGYGRPPTDAETEELEDDDDAGGLPDRFSSPSERFQPQPFNAPQPHFGNQPQPYQDRQPHFSNGQDRQHGQDRPLPERPERGPRPDRPFHDRMGPGRDMRHRDQRPARMERNDPRGDQPRPAFAADQDAPGLPTFITAPVRLNGTPESESEQPDINGPVEAFRPEQNGEGGRFPLHQRRRRRNRPPFGQEGPEAASDVAEEDNSPSAPGEPPAGE
ncbi:MAG: DUF4167 domain-containing protein [Methylobacteriaceae bacterium]|nr:DUF4167 domain-containing protein [Methylobacteriaceae bacterium]MBV9245010.1 DUF4167 domain-containing protein [Methylobacteriaceae bacterium]MBV9634942.1 DUF4167 domain-containing protein [Methylobacteriaceae bacterium]